MPDPSVNWLTYARFGLHAVLALIVMYTDLKERKIYNAVVYPAFLAGLLLACVDAYMVQKYHPEESWWLPLAQSFGGAFFGFFIFLSTFLVNGTGGGDVKLVAAGGALLGFPLIVFVLMFALLSGIVIGMSAIIWQGNLWNFTKRMFNFREWAKKEGGLENSFYKVPMGAAYAIGTAWAFAMYFLGDQ